MPFTDSINRTLRNMSIAKKMRLGYLMLAFLTVVLGVFAIWSLNRLNSLNSTLINIHTPILKTSESLADAVLAQELYARRHAILKSPETLDLMNAKSIEARQFAVELERLASLAGEESDKIIPLFEEYSDILHKGFSKTTPSKSAKTSELDESIRLKQEELITIVRKLSADARNAQERDINAAYRISANAFWITILLCSLCIVAGVFAAGIITRNISRSILTLKKATEHVADGKFNNLPTVESNDEIGDLSKAFGEMAERLHALEEMYLDASPLTHLPGGIAIENVLKKRIASGAELAFCLIDIDNFKSYNDYYGYARGSELIQALGKIIEEETHKIGAQGDFVGHVGGDDFVVISTTENFQDICKSVIARFDKTVPEFYDKEDIERGYITGKTRQGEEMTFPLVTLSIAVVTNRANQITSHLQMGEIAAELKEYAKSLPGSLYVVDHRRKRE